MKPMVSVIMPVYNEEKYVGECVESILAQTFQDFELFCVDNGSTDSSVELLNGYAERDDRVRVLTSDGTAGDARNKGIDAAQGKYLLFLDSDDFFDEKLLEIIVDAAEKHGAEVVLFGGHRFDNKTKKHSERLEFVYPRYCPNAEVFSAFDVAENLFQITTPAPWSKLFSRSFIGNQGLAFQSLQNSNDLYFTLSALSAANKIVALDVDLLSYRVNKEGSAQATKAKSPLCFFEALKALHDRLQRIGRLDVLKDSYVRQLLSTIRYNLNTSRTDEAKVQIFDYLTANWNGWLDLDWGADKNAYSAAACDLRALIAAGVRQFEWERSEHPALASNFICVVPNRVEAPPFFSIVVPAYNVEDYIEETLLSLINQTFGDFEIICIDDGSYDGTLSRVERIAESERRVSLYRQTNSGLSVTRNEGLRLAKGKYVYFIDSDDKLLPNTFESIHKTLTDYELDAVFFDADSFCDEDGTGLEEQILHYDDYYHRNGEYNGVYSGIELMDRFYQNGDYLPSACLYVAKRDLLDSYDAQFIPSIIHEDNAYTFELMLKAERTMHLSNRFYLRRIRQGSIMISTMTFDKVYGYFVCAKAMTMNLKAIDGARVSDAEYMSAFQIVLNVMASAQREYRQLPESELGCLMGLSLQEKKEFEKFVAREGNRLRAMDKKDASIKNLQSANARKQRSIGRLKRKLSESVKEAESMRNSRSFRMVRKLTKPYRYAKRLFSGYRH